AIAIVKGATAAMRAAERHLHLCVCRACRCREEVQAASHHWAAEAVFPLCSAGEATLPAGDVLVCIDTPHGASRRLPLQCHSHCGFIFTNWLCVQCNAVFPSPHKWPPLICFFLRGHCPRPPTGRLLAF
ncbi:hypothetical protein TcG_11455, partial [Trypanosoma cruzi]